MAIHLVSAYVEESLFGRRLDVAAGRMNVENDFASSPLHCQFMNNALRGDPQGAARRRHRTAPAAETFGPGRVSCQILVGEQVDCLLSASRITGGNRNEASFSLTALPPGERALFRKWCLNPADECIVTIQGRREAPQAIRLATVTSLRWRRPLAPMDQAAAAP